MKKIIINADGAILGRLSSYTAKELLKGNTVLVFNSENSVISGKKEYFIEKIKQKRKMGSGGSLKGPKYIRQPDRLLKRIIRGMLPWDKTKGREAYKRLKCFIGTSDFKEEEIKNSIKFDHKKPLRYTTLKVVVGELR